MSSFPVLEPAPAPPAAAAADNNEVILRVQSVSKHYKLWRSPFERLRYSFLSQVHKGLRTLLPSGAQPLAALDRQRRALYRDFSALDDVSFEVRRGECVGIIGRNGAGKSTLLQIIAGTLQPSSGHVEVHGRVAALLELGSGFNPEFTGRENVFLNAAILGLNQAETEARFDEIETFADIGQFIDQPVKNYSSGMMLRLAFAVSICVQPDLLIIDEALSVGDVFFQQKCFERLEMLQRAGVALLLVTHSVNLVEQHCPWSVLLKDGRIHAIGKSPEVVKRYYLLCQGPAEPPAAPAAETSTTTSPSVAADEHSDALWPRSLESMELAPLVQVNDGLARCTFFQICDAQLQTCRHFAQGDTAVLLYEFTVTCALDVPLGGFTLRNHKGHIVHGKHLLQYDGNDSLNNTLPPGGTIRMRQEVCLAVAPGEYTLEIGLAGTDRATLAACRGRPHPELESLMIRLCHLPEAAVINVGWRQVFDRFPLSHYGAADLPGTCHAQALAPPGGS